MRLFNGILLGFEVWHHRTISHLEATISSFPGQSPEELMHYPGVGLGVGVSVHIKVKVF